MLETNKNSGRDGNEKLETITVVPHKERRNETKPASPSWFVAKINPVSRFIGALILCIPMFFTLDVVSASVAFGLEMLLLWIGGVAPLDGLAQDMAGMDSGHRQLRFRGVVRQDIRHGAGQSGRHHRHLPRIALSGVGHIPTCRRNRRAGCDSGFGTRPDRSGRRTRADSAPAATFRIRRPCRHAHVHAAAGRLACTRPVTPLAWPRRRQHHQTRLLASIQPARRIHPTWNETRHRHGSARIRIPTRHEAKRANRNCMRSTGCSTPSASRCRQSRWPPHTTPATGIGRSATCPTNG